MSFHFSKSKFVSSCIRCNKYAWLDKYMPEEKSPIDDFAKSLFDNGHKVGELAKEYFKAGDFPSYLACLSSAKDILWQIKTNESLSFGTIF